MAPSDLASGTTLSGHACGAAAELEKGTGGELDGSHRRG